ncbi:uncharacterized protein LOC126676976 [Mercurialis annua]|uniref:uncharacterized protein LOC126676976 n=1 Tax=Mercurialis annua TaxID=3986 RepID=UPI00215FF51E|nr:uncharacterized protein LOC126676976 [Mercurialis annua]
MSLKKLMEENQLDFNQPFLSVRRFSSEPDDNKTKTENAFSKVPPLPKYKSELKSGPVRDPGTVPFVWERSPGRPKYESKRQVMALKQPPVVPKLPPGRVVNVERQAGQAEARNGSLSSHNVPSSDKNVIRDGSSRAGTEENDTSGSEDDDETYVDAVDTLSRSESFFYNCSISGVSGLDGPDKKQSGTFSTDVQTRDFMMGRFLPAAKAMTSEAPQHFTRKQPVPQEQPKQIKNMASVEQRRPFNECRRQNVAQNSSQYNGAEETEEEDDDYDRPDNSSLGVCGLLPRLCLQNSFCLLNPVPGMRRNLNENVNDAISMQRSSVARQTKAPHQDNKDVRSDLNKNACRIDNQKLNGSSLYKRLQGNGTSPFREKFSQSVVHDDKGFLGFPEKSKTSPTSGFNGCAKGGKIFRELLANELESASASSVAEKTLYVDSIQTVELQNSDSNYVIDYRRDDVLKVKGVEETAFDDSSVQDIKHTNAVSEKANVMPESLDRGISSLLSSSERSSHDEQKMDDSRHNDQDVMVVSVIPANRNVDGDGNIDLESSNDFIDKASDNGKTYSKSQLTGELGNQETFNGCYSLRRLPLPLPKAPTESWLKRTLPTVSSKITSLSASPGVHVYPIIQASKVRSPDPKWETMVKTTNVQHGHLRFSEELLTPIPEV